MLLVVLVGVLVLCGGTSLGLASDVDPEPTVTMMLFETDIREALSEMALQTGVNIIPDQSVGGVITADLVDVPLRRP